MNGCEQQQQDTVESMCVGVRENEEEHTTANKFSLYNYILRKIFPRHII